MRKFWLILIGWVAILAVAGGVHAATFSTYGIGNSLTADSNVKAMDDMAANQGISAEADWHILNGQGLDAIWNNPTTTSIGQFFAGPFPTALSNQAWNAITVEPFGGQLTGTSGDINRINDFMHYAANLPGGDAPPISIPAGNAGNINAQFYIFARWAEQGAWAPGYDEAWNKTYTGDTGVTDETADYYNQLLADVRAVQPSDMNPIQLIPTGFVFDAIDKELRNGGLQGLGSMQNLYRDSFHLSEIGSFVASTTFYATIFHQDPSGMVPSSVDYPGLDQTTVNQLESIVWNVVNTTPGTGVPEPNSIALLALSSLFMRRR